MYALTEAIIFGLEKVPRVVYGRLARYLLRKVQGQVVCRNMTLQLDPWHEASPMLNFQCIFDNKTVLTLTAQHVTVVFYMASSIIDTVIWSSPESDIQASEGLPMPVNRVEDLKPKGEAKLNLWCPLHPYYLQSDYMRGWSVKGIAVFNSKIGNFHVPISHSFPFEAEAINQAKNKYKIT